jgi:hypothetical protein
MKRECESCIKRKTPYCPNSTECMATDDMPYYQNRIMLLEENKQLEDNWNILKEFIDTLWLDNKGIVTNIKDKIELIEQGSDEQMYDKCSDCEYTNYDNYVQTVETQQKEFISYLEDEIEKATTNPYTKLSEYGMNRIHIYKEILQKYKEIIGDDK